MSVLCRGCQHRSGLWRLLFYFIWLKVIREISSQRSHPAPATSLTGPTGPTGTWSPSAKCNHSELRCSDIRDQMFLYHMDGFSNTHCRSSCRRPAEVDPQDRCSSKTLVCSHTGAHSRAPLCYTCPYLQIHNNKHQISDHISGGNYLAFDGFMTSDVLIPVYLSDNGTWDLRDTIITPPLAQLNTYTSFFIFFLQLWNLTKHGFVLIRLLNCDHWTAFVLFI